MVVPIRWNTTDKTYDLLKPMVATRCDIDNTSFPLREGPVPIKDIALKKFLDKYNLPNYKNTPDTTDYTIDGEDPIWEVEAIQGKKGKGSKAQYLIKWKGHSKL